MINGLASLAAVVIAILRLRGRLDVAAEAPVHTQMAITMIVTHTPMQHSGMRAAITIPAIMARVRSAKKLFSKSTASIYMRYIERHNLKPR